MTEEREPVETVDDESPDDTYAEPEPKNDPVPPDQEDQP